MKLSEALMMLGMSKPQGVGCESISDPTAPCAIGGALQMIGKQLVGDQLGNYSAFTSVWPWTATVVTLPNGLTDACGNSENRVDNCVWLLNDFHHWTRAKIAEWVASIEPADDLEPQAPAVESVKGDVEIIQS